MKDANGAEVRRTVSHILKSGRTITMSTLSRRDIVCAEEEAVRYYRRQWLETWMGNVDLIPTELRQAKIDEAFQKATTFSVSNLPKMPVALPVRGDNGVPLMRQVAVPYTAWWASETDEGRAFNIWRSMLHDPSQQTVSLDEVKKMFDDEVELERAAQVAGEVSESKLGNSSAPPGEGNRRRRRRRR